MASHEKSRRLLASGFALILLLCAPMARAQCFPDGLSGGDPCTPPALALPQFPEFEQTTRLICFNDCDAQVDRNVRVTINEPRPVDFDGSAVCGFYRIRFEVRTDTAVPKLLWRGSMRAFYSRTWNEQTDEGRVIQIWRFLLNGDLTPTALLERRAANRPCYLPSCYLEFDRVFFWGHIDYVRDCQDGSLGQVAWALHHDCDAIEHRSDSERPGDFHPDASISFVGPSAGFTVGSPGPLDANGNTEAVRRNDFTALPSICRFEDPITQLGLDAQDPICLCGDGPGLYYPTILNISSAAPSFFQTVDANPTILQKPIGSWALGGGVYPGNESLIAVTGELHWTDGCDSNEDVSHFRGVASKGGYSPVVPHGTPLSTKFLDLGSSNRRAAGGIYLGRPYVSWWILNVNTF